MKSSIHFYLVILLLLSSYTIAKAQPCLPFGITLTTQTAVDSFVVDHPGCTEIQGVLVVASGNTNPITNLQGLSVITKVMGGVYIQHNTQLSSLNGLSSLQTIHGGLHIIENTGLIDLSGLEGLEVLNGSLQVKENEGLLSLNGLQGLHLINGSVLVDQNHQMISLHGLDSIGNILGDLDIHYNLGLLNVDHLSKLSSVSGDLSFHINNSVVSILGFSSLQHVGGNFKMQSNWILENSDGFESLGLVGGDVIFDGTRLVEITSLNALNTIGGSLIIRSNTKLETLEGLINLNSINGELYIRSNNQLENLYGLDNIDPEGITELTIRNCTRLNTCEVASICSFLNMGGIADVFNNKQGCLSVEQVNLACEAVEDSTLCLLQGITISRQGQLDSFAINYPGCVHILGNVTIQSGTQDPINNVGGLNHIEMIGGDLNIRQNSSLIHLIGFDSLLWVGGTIRIEYNVYLLTLQGFNILEQIEGALVIVVSYSTNQVSGFSKLERTGNNFNFNGTMGIQEFGGFPSLKFVEESFILKGFKASNFNGFNQLQTIGKNLTLSSLYEVIDLEGLNNLTSLGVLSIEQSSSLSSLSGLENLTSVERLRFMYNPLLTDISALSNISPDSLLSINIQNNYTLSNCSYSNICAFLESGKLATISNNATGCKTKEEVLSICITSSGEVIGLDGSRPEIIVFPNPASAYLNIIAPEDLIFKAGVYNITGQLLRTFQFTETEVISLHDLPSGLYVLVLEYEGGMISRKVVIE